VVQSHPVPNTGALHLGRQGIAHLRKDRLQSLQTGKLLGRGVERNVDNRVHIGKYSISSYMKFFTLSENYFPKSGNCLPLMEGSKLA
jgi:hypothetical protein